MRSKRKMETVRIRKANATIKKEKVVCFAQDRDVSTRILAILSVGQTKSGVKKETKGADGKVTVAFVPEITRYKVICGSTGKLIKCVHRITHSNFSNREIINDTISWSSTSEGSDYWFGLYVNTKK